MAVICAALVHSETSVDSLKCVTNPLRCLGLAGAPYILVPSHDNGR